MDIKRARQVVFLIFCPLFSLAVLPGLFAQPASLEVGAFSQSAPEAVSPEGWEPLLFPKIKAHTQYSLVREDGVAVVRAESRSSSSGLVRKMEIDPRAYPVIRWRWKAASVFPKGDVTKKSGDDYPARIYVTFRYDPDKLGAWDRAKYGAAKLLYGEHPPHAAINYIWASKAPVGMIVPNAYSDRVMMIVVESGLGKLGVWVDEERNILEDYRKAFGQEPPPISGVAIMTDTDNTQESTISYFGDISFSAQ